MLTTIHFHTDRDKGPKIELVDMELSHECHLLKISNKDTSLNLFNTLETLEHLHRTIGCYLFEHRPKEESPDSELHAQERVEAAEQLERPDEGGSEPQCVHNWIRKWPEGYYYCSKPGCYARREEE